MRVQNTAVVTRTLSGNTYTITVPAGVTVTAGNTISVVFSGTGGIQNPATAGSSYTLSVYTSVGAAQQVSSSNFTIVSGAAPTAGNVTVSPNTANTTAAYSVAFTTSANGKLITGDKIFLTFPSGTTIPSSISASSVSVNGTVCSVAPSVSGQLVTVTVPSQINISTAVSVNFNLSAGLVNPPAATYTAGTGLTLYTTINNVSVTENSYTIVANTNLTPATVTLSPSTVNTISQYTLSFTNGNSSVLVSDYFEIIFPAGTVIPSVISTSTVSINGVAPTTVTTTPASNLVKVYPGSTVNSDQAVSLVFNQAAGIQNPSTSGGKTLTVSKNSGTAITSSSYTVTTSTGTAATVSLSPSTNNVSGGYTISYSAGVGGALTANSGTITVTFPSGTTVPASISANQITVNSTPVSVNPTINTTNRTVAFVTPVNISNSGSVVIVFSTGAGITNPASVASNYTLSVASSAEPSAVTSQVYAITSATDVGVATVTTVSNLISTATNYTVSFLTNSTFSPGSTTVTLAFPTGTTIGTLTGNVQIGANDANYQTVGTISTSGLQVTLTIPAASGFTAGTDVCWVKFNANSITNPATAGSNKTISVKQGSGNFVTSNRYTIITTGLVTSFTVSPSPNTGNSPAAYSIAFTTGSNGALFAGDAIAITFPDGTTLPGSIAASAISVNSIAATVAPNISGQILTIYIPDNISVSSSVSITIALSAGITNPTSGIDKQATLTTTSQTGVASSANYTIINSTNITSSTVTLSNTTVKTTSQYQLDFTNGTAAINAGGTLAVTFAGGYTLPGSITTGNVTVQSGSPLVTRTISTVGVAGQVITLTLGASQTIAASTPVRVTFAVGAALVNPTTASATYTLSIAATGNGSATSSNYSITASTITTPALTLGNSAISATTTNSIAFTTGAAGALTSGVSTLTVTFPAGTTVPGSITASNISVNAVDATTVSSNATTRVVTITSPVSVTDHGSVTVLFKAGAAIVNPSTAGSYTLSVFTSAETTPVSSSTYTITTGTTITSPTVSRSSNVSAATSNYTISFNLGSAGTIGNGNFIYVSFPTGTVVSGVNTGNSLINGVAPSAVTITGQEVRLTNNSGTIANSASVTLSFTGLTNPTTAVSNYTLSAKTNVENNYVASSVYKVIATSNTMTPAIVTNSDNFINANATYAITYTNGSNGKLLTGDKIYLTFAAGYSLTQIASGSVQVNNVATTTATTVSGQTFTVTTPVDINAGASVTINLLDATKISNPPTAGNITLSVSSDIETSNKTSTSYPIYFLDGSLPVELTSFTVKQNKGAVLIEWTTESELDNAMFKVFRTDSETGEANEITRIAGMGTKSSRTDYKYLDKLVTAGKKYSYQLIDYSYDGTESIHDAVTIEIETPKVFNLEQNYPNPFNPETTVPFAVPFKANVSLEVYNILGQRVKVLVNDVYEPGVYSLVWNGRNDNGEMASTGVYFIRMQAATFNKVLKMTLLK
ncbi:MAG: hypothetical protein LCH54_10100 [Bacteroidetes bacterium]|nr:hypothetical protein [Bacteroidota bacterium]